VYCWSCGHDVGSNPGSFCSKCGVETNLEERGSATWRQVLHVWWALAWRSLLLIIPCALVLGLFGGVIAALFDPGPGKGAEYAGALGSLGAIPAFFLTLKWVLNRRTGSITLFVKSHHDGKKK
jgi:hypothetical protein